jgi:hypothetical protein
MAVEIITSDLLQTAQGLRSTGLQSSVGISRPGAKVDKTATSPPLNGRTAIVTRCLCRVARVEVGTVGLEACIRDGSQSRLYAVV